VLELMHLMRASVRERFGVELAAEVDVIGAAWP
jgi:UDP-N-acetylenolpyruvoylglucosamine reductase